MGAAESDSSTTNRVIEIDGRVVGHIASFDLEGRRELTYWIGREDWGRGIATRALQEFLQLEATRPLYAGAASDNAASIRVLTKYGFVMWPCEGVRSAAEDFLLRVGVDHPVAQWIEQRFYQPLELVRPVRAPSAPRGARRSGTSAGCSTT